MTKIMNRKLLSVLLTLALIVSMFAGLTLDASANTITITVSTPAELIAIATNVAAGNTYSGYYIQITADLDFSSNPSWTGIGTPTIANVSSTSSPYVTSSGYGFEGILDGAEYDNNGAITAIHTITVARTASSSGIGGVVNYLAPAGTVKNLNVSGTVSVTGSVDAVGGVVGYNSGTITNVTSDVAVTATGAYNVGGIAGFNNAYYNTSGTHDTSGNVKGTITHCANTGAINGYSKVGGITGENAGTINACSNTAYIHGNYANKSGIGGIAGRNGNNGTAQEVGTITNCYNHGYIVSGTPGSPSTQGKWVGGIAGFQSSGCMIDNCYNTGNLVAYSFAEHMAGNDEGTTTHGYALSTATGAGGYYSVILMSQSNMQATTFRDTLNSNASSTTLWAQTAGSYPTLTAPTSAPFTIVKAHDPTTTTYNVGDTFDDTGLVINAVYTDSTPTQQITDYMISPNGPLGATVTAVTVYGTYQGVAYSFSIPITVTPGEIKLGGANGYTTLAAAINAAGPGGTIYVYGQTNLTAPLTLNDDVTVVRKQYNDGTYAYSGAFFNVTGSGNVTLTSMTIDGNGTGTLFEVDNGANLRLRGNIQLKNADTAVEVGASGTVQINKAVFSNVTYSVDALYSTSTVLVDNYGGTVFAGSIRLQNSAKITLGSTLMSLDKPIVVTGAATGSTVAVGNGSHTVDDADAGMIALGTDDSKFAVFDGTTVIAKDAVTLNSATYSSLMTEISSSGGNKVILVGSTITLTASDNLDLSGNQFMTYIARKSGFTGALFEVNNAGSTIVMKNVKVGGSPRTYTLEPLIDVAAGTLHFANTATLYGNFNIAANSSGKGGALGLTGGSVKIEGVISGNRANTGAGVYGGDGGDFSMSDGRISYNVAYGDGGAVYVTSHVFEMLGGKIENNTVKNSGAGAAVFLVSGSGSNAAQFKMQAGTITGNSAKGGTVSVNSGTTFTLSGGTIGGSTADGNEVGYGGAAFVTGGTFKMDGGTISYNTASVNGGAVCLNSGTFEMTDGTISGNAAGSNGPGVYVASSGTFIVNPGSAFLLSDIVYLVSNQKVYLAGTTSGLSANRIQVKCADASSGRIIATGTGSYVIDGTYTDEDGFSSADGFIVEFDLVDSLVLS